MSPELDAFIKKHANQAVTVESVGVLVDAIIREQDRVEALEKATSRATS